MKRLGVFVLCDPQGIVSECTKVLLDGIKLCLNELIIIVNGFLNEDAKNELADYSSNVYFRENIGFDAGAYKDLFLSYRSDENWDKWDEILLFNDSFYGPMRPFREVFSRMEKEPVDFWGLIKHPGGEKILGEEVSPHIQSFFLVCRKKLFTDVAFTEFWKQLDYPTDYLEAVRDFEIGFSYYFMKRGYVANGYANLFDVGNDISKGKNIYNYKACALMKEIDFPIVKRKSLYFQWKEVLDFIKRESSYDEKLIINDLERRGMLKGDEVLPFTPEELKRFVVNHQRIYIYGNGLWGKRIQTYFLQNELPYEGVLVSQNNIKEEDVLEFDQVKLEENDGIILALGVRVLHEVYPILKEKVDDKNLFVLY